MRARCIDCGTPTKHSRRRINRCRSCVRARDAVYNDPDYRNERSEYRQMIAIGEQVRCWICGRIIGEVKDFSLDHSPPISTMPVGEWRGELKPSHRKCNVRPDNPLYR